MRFVPAGLLAVVVAASTTAFAGEKLALEAVPEPARQTIAREVAGGRITEIERETKRGRLVYEVEYVTADQDWEIKVAPDGMLLEKKRD